MLMFQTFSICGISLYALVFAFVFFLTTMNTHFIWTFSAQNLHWMSTVIATKQKTKKNVLNQQKTQRKNMLFTSLPEVVINPLRRQLEEPCKELFYSFCTSKARWYACQQCATTDYALNWSRRKQTGLREVVLFNGGSCCRPLSNYRPYVCSFSHKPVLHLNDDNIRRNIAKILCTMHWWWLKRS